jgi:CTP:molybdopterin cytidylyltransferase MocA
MSDAVAIILAAGAGRRLGGVAKALLPAAGGASFLEAIVRTAAAAGAARAIAVVGAPHGDEVARAAAALGVEVAWNPDPSRGMASSVAVGFAAALERAGDAEVALLWPVDHAAVAATTVTAVLAARAPAAVVPTFGGRGGHPVAIRRALWSQLAACGALPEGARSVLRAAAAQGGGAVLRLAVDDPGVVADVDLPGDLARASRGAP